METAGSIPVRGLNRLVGILENASKGGGFSRTSSLNIRVQGVDWSSMRGSYPLRTGFESLWTHQVAVYVLNMGCKH